MPVFHFTDRDKCSEKLSPLPRGTQVMCDLGSFSFTLLWNPSSFLGPRLLKKSEPKWKAEACLVFWYHFNTLRLTREHCSFSFLLTGSERWTQIHWGQRPVLSVSAFAMSTKWHLQEMRALKMSLWTFHALSQGPCSGHVATCALSPQLGSRSQQPATQKQGPLCNNPALTAPTKLHTAPCQCEQTL